jgi:hypothetical protein
MIPERQTELSRNFLGRIAFHHDAPECLPRLLFDIGQQ